MAHTGWDILKSDKMKRHMFHKIQRYSTAGLLVLGILNIYGLFCVPAMANASSIQPAGQFAAACNPSAGKGGLSEVLFVPWYKYLPGDNSDGKCRVALGDNPDIVKTASLVLIAVIELLTRLATLVAVGYVIWGSIQYITSQGEAQSLSNAKSTIANALVGLAITILAISLLQFLGRTFGA